jgi:hypothetical protein
MLKQNSDKILAFLYIFGGGILFVDIIFGVHLNEKSNNLSSFLMGVCLFAILFIEVRKLWLRKKNNTLFSLHNDGVIVNDFFNSSLKVVSVKNKTVKIYRLFYFYYFALMILLNLFNVHILFLKYLFVFLTLIFIFRSLKFQKTN